jgi:hypothetical protein
MMAIIQKVIKHIFRGWSDVGHQVHPRMKILPPIFWVLLAYAILFAILFQIGKYVINLF